MQIDKVTFNDISIFHTEEEFSIFHRLNFTQTVGGKEWLRRFFLEPHHDLNRIIGVQNIIKTFLGRIDEWPKEITNGTVIMMDKFLDYNLDPVPEHPTAINSLIYKILHPQDFSMARFSVKHFCDFFRGLKKILQLLSETQLPANLSFYIDRIKKILQEKPLKELADRDATEDFTHAQVLYFAYFLRRDYKSDILELIDVFSRL